MVVKVVGNIDGNVISFDREDGSDLWVASVPNDLFGEYVVELRAYDEAGNIAYATKMLYVANKEDLTVTIRPLRYSSEDVEVNFNNVELNNIFNFKELGNKYHSKELPYKYSFRMVIKDVVL